MRLLTHPPRRKGAFALILTLLILSVLAIVAVSFLASMSSERATANAFANKARAEQAARSGTDSAMAILKDTFQRYPDSATVWDTTQATNSEGTTLFLRAKANSSGNAPDPAAAASDNRPPATNGAADPRLTFVLPLVSGATPKLWSNKAAAVPALNVGVSDPILRNYAELNQARFANDTQGSIGSPPGTTLKPARAPWVETTDAKGRVTSRYAYWVEDESFRTNVNYASQGDRPTNPHARRDNSANLAAGPTYNDLVAPLLALNNTSLDAVSAAQGIFDTRASFPLNLFPEFLGYAHGSRQSTVFTDGQTVADHLRYLVTTSSGGLNISRHGSQRLNLNNTNVVNPNTSPTDIGTMQAEADRLVQTIRFHAPNFGERFYRTSTATGSTTLNAFQVNNGTTNGVLRRDIYLFKVAANLRDYLDVDSQPTMINLDGTIYAPTPRRPQLAFGQDGPNPIAAMGKEAVPYLQEAATLFSGSVKPAAGGSYRYSLNVDYYVEFWNMTNRVLVAGNPPNPAIPNDTKVYLGSDAFVRFAAQPGWLADDSVAGNAQQEPRFPELTSDDSNPTPPTQEPINSASLGVANARDFDVSLANGLRGAAGTSGPVTFDPGVATVITTDPDWVANGYVANKANCFYCSILVGPGGSNGKRFYNGPMPTFVEDGITKQSSVIKLYFRTTPSLDIKTEVVLGNSNGYLDCFQGALPVFNSGGNRRITFSKAGNIPAYFAVGNLMGNVTTPTEPSIKNTISTPSQLGDPRTNNEPLVFTLYDTLSGDPPDSDQCSYFRIDRINANNASKITLGDPNSGLSPAAGNPWPDYWDFPSGKVNPNVTSSPMVVANGALTSIGQLGDIFDPARVQGVKDIEHSRGGGRTLQIGQHDDRYDGTATSNGISNSTGWASWRLADFFGTSDSVFLPGLININGLARDNGAALRAALRGFNFQPLTADDPTIHGDAKLAAKPLDSTGLQNFIDSIINSRLKNTDATKPGPFFERGEISETPLLNPASASVLVTGVSFSQIFDRGREELVRRLTEMITTRGDVFTVYSVGQSISQTNAADPKTKRITGTSQFKTTFQLVPRNLDGSDFNPGAQQLTFAHGNAAATRTAVANRFAMPDHYEVVLLSSR